MDFTGQHIIPAPRTEVWRAINDRDVLAACLPGCERFERTGEATYTATIAIRIGSLAARFSGTLAVTEAEPGCSCVLDGAGQGGIAGFARGTARVTLEDHPDGTRLTYDARAEIGGKLASLGGRLIHSFAAATADAFFLRLCSKLKDNNPLG